MKRVLSLIGMFVSSFLTFATDLPPRAGAWETDLANAVVIAPSDPTSQAQGERVAKQLGIPLIKDTDAVTARGEFVRSEYRMRPLIILGNINNNQAIIPLYARYLSWADADYPGHGGYTVRTVRTPFEFAPVNTILLEASDEAGLTKAVDAFLQSPQLADKKCGFLFDLHPKLSGNALDDLAKLKRIIPEFLRNGKVDEAGTVVGQCAVAYYLTGDKTFEPLLQSYARNMASGKIRFPGGHYFWESHLRAIELITNSNLIDAATTAKIDSNLYDTIYSLRGDFGIRRNQQQPLARHQFSPTYSYMMICDLLLRNLGAAAPETVKTFLKSEFAATSAHFKYAIRGPYCGTDDSNATASNITSVFQASLALGDPAVFNNGLAMDGIKRMIATVDNRGHGCGVGIYEDAYEEGNTKMEYANGGPLCYGAFFLRNGKLKWLSRHAKGLHFSAWFVSRTWFGLHKYATGDDLPESAPGNEFRCVAAIGAGNDLQDYKEIPGFSAARSLNKAAMRSGTGEDDAYLCIQGTGSGKEGLPTEKSDTLVLLRYTDQGVLWLAGNSQLTGGAWRNSFMVSDSSPDSKAPGWVTRLDFLGNIPGGMAFAASVPAVRHGKWTRRAVRLDNGLLLIADTFVAGKDGEYSFLQTFKTPVPAAISADGNHVVAAEAGYRLTVSGTAGTVLSMDHGIRRMEPQDFWYFRRSIDRKLRAGEKITVGSLFAVRPYSRAEEFPVLVELAPDRFAVGIGNDFHEVTFNADKVTITPLSTPISSTASVPASPQSAVGLKVVATAELPSDAMPMPLRGWKVIAPQLSAAHVLSDNAVKRWDLGAGYGGKTPMVIDLGKTETLGGMRCFTTTRSLTEKNLSPMRPFTLKIEGATSPDFSQAVSRNVRMDFTPETRDLYKLTSWQLDAFSGNTALSAVRYLRITGLPARMAELVLFSDRQIPARIEQLQPLPHGGVAVRTSDRRILGFADNGKELFRIQLMDNPISFFVDSECGLLVISENHQIQRFDFKGQLRQETTLFQRPCTLAVLKNSDGSRKIGVCYYYHFQFLAPDLKPLTQPKGFGAMWTETAAALDVNGDKNDDLIMHDIFGRGYIVDGASGNISSLRPMPLGIDNAIFPADSAPGTLVLAGQERISSLDAGGKLKWEYFDGSQYSGAVLHDNLVYAARFTGHVAIMHAGTGKIIGFISPGGRIFALAYSQNTLWVATDHGLLGYDHNYRQTAFLPGMTTALTISGNAIWAIMDGKLTRVEK